MQVGVDTTEDRQSEACLATPDPRPLGVKKGALRTLPILQVVGVELELQ